MDRRIIPVMKLHEEFCTNFSFFDSDFYRDGIFLFVYKFYFYFLKSDGTHTLMFEQCDNAFLLLRRGAGIIRKAYLIRKYLVFVQDFDFVQDT